MRIAEEEEEEEERGKGKGRKKEFLGEMERPRAKEESLCFLSYIFSLLQFKAVGVGCCFEKLCIKNKIL